MIYWQVWAEQAQGIDGQKSQAEMKISTRSWRMEIERQSLDQIQANVNGLRIQIRFGQKEHLKLIFKWCHQTWRLEFLQILDKSLNQPIFTETTLKILTMKMIKRDLKGFAEILRRSALRDLSSLLRVKTMDLLTRVAVFLLRQILTPKLPKNICVKSKKFWNKKTHLVKLLSKHSKTSWWIQSRFQLKKQKRF